MKQDLDPDAVRYINDLLAIHTERRDVLRCNPDDREEVKRRGDIDQLFVGQPVVVVADHSCVLVTLLGQDANLRILGTVTGTTRARANRIVGRVR